MDIVFGRDKILATKPTCMCVLPCVEMASSLSSAVLVVVLIEASLALRLWTTAHHEEENHEKLEIFGR